MNNIENVYQQVAELLAQKASSNWVEIMVTAPILPDRCGGISLNSFAESGDHSDIDADIEMVTFINESFLKIRDEVLKVSGKLPWSIEFRFNRQGKFSVKFGYEKPSWFDEPLVNDNNSELVSSQIYKAEWQTTVENEAELIALGWLREVTDQHRADWHLGGESNWSIDVPNGSIRWMFSDGTMKNAHVQFLGTFKPNNSEFRWAWANSSIPEDFQKAAVSIRELGQKNKIEEFLQPAILADEMRAWAWTAMAARILGAQGAYRVRTGDVWLYLTFNDLA